MATWAVDITPIDVDRKEVRISAVRTDDTDPDDVQVETHTIMSAIIDTAAQKLAAMDHIWGMHLAEVAKQAKIAALIDQLESQAVTNLQERE